MLTASPHHVSQVVNLASLLLSTLNFSHMILSRQNDLRIKFYMQQSTFYKALYVNIKLFDTCNLLTACGSRYY